MKVLAVGEEKASTVCMCVYDRRRCKVEQVVPCGAANVVYCNGLNSDDDDDDVICLDDEPVLKQSRSHHSTGFVANYSAVIRCRTYHHRGHGFVSWLSTAM